MRRLPPSELVREEIQELFTTGVEEGANILSRLAELGVRYLAQQALEQEQEDHLGRGRYERRGEHQTGWRNGYEDARLRTAEGEVTVRIPQVRGGEAAYRSKLIEFLQGHSDVLERLVTEMYARGLSTRDVEDCFRDATGELLISKSAVSEITDRLWEDYQAFCSRDLSSIEVEYLFLDAIYESLRRHGAKEGVLAAWCVTSEGRKVLLHLAVGNKESEACWTEFLRSMVARGLRTPTSVTCDGAPGLVNAVTAVFPQSLRIRCWYHKLGNVRQKLPAEEAEEVLAHLRAVRDAPTYEAGREAAARTIERYRDRFPAAMACFADDLEASLAHLRLPLRHRVICRTTNLIERSFEEERRRTKVIPRFGDERQAMKLVFAVLIRAAERWARVPMSELERAQLALLRQELGIDPPPRSERKEVGARTAAA
ncbi:MAG TPA: IS256 family transposase [Actinomycetota bacterium]|nr:IS256 family transposase [Actinomycetota bacterium]